jgi:sensor c-di-GMP phosphodiesterase-like protein
MKHALTVAHGRTDEWVKKTLEHSMAEAKKALAAASDYFKSRLTGAWERLLWACIGGGLMAGALLLAGGFWLGRNW